MTSQRQFVLVHACHRTEGAAEIIAHSGLLNSGMRSQDVKSVLVVVKIDRRISPEIDRIRTGDKHCAIVFRIEHLHRQRLPTSGRTAVSEARPTLPNSAKLLFNRGN